MSLSQTNERASSESTFCAPNSHPHDVAKKIGELVVLMVQVDRSLGAFPLYNAGLRLSINMVVRLQMSCGLLLLYSRRYSRP